MLEAPSIKLDGDVVVRNLKNKWPQLECPDDVDCDGNTLVFSIGSAEVVIGQMAAPILDGELDGPCTTSLLWPQASKEVNKHQSHAIVTILNAPNQISSSTLLTYAVASLMLSDNSAIGVYWPDAGMVHSKKAFVELATECLPKQLPILLWVNCCISPVDKSRANGFTRGMQALGHPELETKEAPEKATELYDRFNRIG